MKALELTQQFKNNITSGRFVVRDDDIDDMLTLLGQIEKEVKKMEFTEDIFKYIEVDEEKAKRQQPTV